MDISYSFGQPLLLAQVVVEVFQGSVVLLLETRDVEVVPGDLHQLVLPHEVVEVPVEGVGVGLRPGLLQPGVEVS